MQSPNNPFIRNIELLIGPLADDVGGGNSSEALRIFSDGGREDLAIEFNIKKYLQSSANTADIVIYNMRAESRERIRATLSRVRMRVGWANTGLSLLMQGGVLNVRTPKDGAEYVTKLTVLDGFGGITKGVTNRTFLGGQSVETLVRSIAADMPGVELGRIDIDGILSSGGLTVLDRSSNELDNLANQYGFTWSVQDGRFQAISDNRAFDRVFEINAENQNLINITPTLAGAMQHNNGVTIESILNPEIRPGDQMRVTSISNPMLNGSYKVFSVEFSGATYNSDWIMVTRAFKILEVV